MPCEHSATLVGRRGGILSTCSLEKAARSQDIQKLFQQTKDDTHMSLISGPCDFIAPRCKHWCPVAPSSGHATIMIGLSCKRLSRPDSHRNCCP
eukprot:489854-Pyramimonas_sp.AAC.1